MLLEFMIVDLSISILVYSLKQLVPLVIFHRLNFLCTRPQTSMGKSLLQLINRNESIFIHIKNVKSVLQMTLPRDQSCPIRRSSNKFIKTKSFIFVDIQVLHKFVPVEVIPTFFTELFLERFSVLTRACTELLCCEVATL